MWLTWEILEYFALSALMKDLNMSKLRLITSLMKEMKKSESSQSVERYTGTS